MIGLLQCDHIAPAFQHIANDYDVMFAQWLPDKWKVYDLTAMEGPADVNECTAYVTTGSKASVYDDEPWIHHFAQIVRDIHAADIPFLGVCFGHQMMAHALGGRVAPSARGWGIGVHRFQVPVHQEWMQPPLDHFGVIMSCRDQVEELPPGAVVLAGNSHCPVGLIRIGSMIGIQGHPEFTPAYAEALLKQRAPAIGQQLVDSAIPTLSDPRHSQELAKWWRRFVSLR